MLSPETITAAEILMIPEEEPERLFHGDEAALRREFIDLAKRWHPDRNSSIEAPAVFARLVALRKAAKAKLGDRARHDGGLLRVEAVDGRFFQLKTNRHHEFELGEMVIAKRRVGFVVDKPHEALFRAGVQQIEAIAYPDDRMRRDLARFLPKVEHVFVTRDNNVAIFEKPEEAVLLADLLDHLGGALPPKHVAWVISCLLNLATFFEVSGLTHNALSAATVFVAPKFHAAYILGGWWYAAPVGARLEVLPDATHAVLPPSIASTQRADIRLDLESVRAIGRAALGDPTGHGLIGRPDLPRPMANFLRLPSCGSALEDYRTWHQVLRESFGPRRFVELPVSFGDVYP
jgi:hypothetical protein